MILPKPNLPLSPVLRLALESSVLTLFGLSKELFALAGGVVGPLGLVIFLGASVGLRTAGIYKGDFIGRSCRDWLGTWANWDLGDVGEPPVGVAVAEVSGEMG